MGPSANVPEFFPKSPQNRTDCVGFEKRYSRQLPTMTADYGETIICETSVSRKLKPGLASEERSRDCLSIILFLRRLLSTSLAGECNRVQGHHRSHGHQGVGQPIWRLDHLLAVVADSCDQVPQTWNRTAISRGLQDDPFNGQATDSQQSNDQTH